MSTVEEAIAWRNRHGIALVKAFGFDPDRVYQDGIDLHGLDGGVTFRTLDGLYDFHGDDLTNDHEDWNPKWCPHVEGRHEVDATDVPPARGCYTNACNRCGQGDGWHYRKERPA